MGTVLLAGCDEACGAQVTQIVMESLQECGVLRWCLGFVHVMGFVVAASPLEVTVVLILLAYHGSQGGAAQVNGVPVAGEGELGCNPHQARTLLDAACDIDPLSEELARRAMQAAAALGDLDGIRHRLDTIRRDLDDAGTEFETDIEQHAATLIKQLHHAQREDN